MGKQLGNKPTPGDAAPAFDLPSDSGRNVKLSDFEGRPVVLYFYPRDNTPGCTREAQAFTALAPAFKKAGATVLGVSKDSVASHCGFRDKLALKIALLSDPDLGVHEAYGAYGEKTMYGKKVTGVIRSTFLIDGSGKVARAWPSVKVDGHAEKVLEAVHDLGGAAPKKAAPKKAAPKKAVKKPTATKKRR